MSMHTQYEKYRSYMYVQFCVYCIYLRLATLCMITTTTTATNVFYRFPVPKHNSYVIAINLAFLLQPCRVQGIFSTQFTHVYVHPFALTVVDVSFLILS